MLSRSTSLQYFRSGWSAAATRTPGCCPLVELLRVQCLHISSSAEPIYPRRVVVTGVGLVSPLGVGVATSWSNLVAGKTGITELSGDEYADLPSRVAGRVPRGSDAGQWQTSTRLDRSESLSTRFALSAAAEALAMARWQPTSDRHCSRTGVSLGSSLPGLDDVVQVGQHLQQKNYRKVSPYFIPRILVNMPAGVISVKHGFKGPNIAMATACATGIHSIGEAMCKIRYNKADVMLAGGTEMGVTPIAMAGFARAKALSTAFNSQPELASRPFDADRDGFVIGEGAGAVVLEEYSHAKDRGANILCEVLGYGMSGDAHHITAPSEKGLGARAAMTSALDDGGIQAEQVAFLAAHATSTPLGDAAEARAIQAVFGDHCQQLHITAFKGALGHLLGAAGAVEAILAIQAMHNGQLPSIRNLQTPDVGDSTQHLNFVRHNTTLPTPDASNHLLALINSFGFGGTNASLCIGSVS